MKVSLLVAALALSPATALAASVETTSPKAGASSVSAAARADAAIATGGGALARPPAMAPREAPGARARLGRNGLAIPPAAAPERIKAVIRAGNQIARKPYKWGGGHALLEDSGYDCSGSVSYALRKARLMTTSLASTGFMSWGRPGPGRWITVRANSGHAYMVVAGLRFDTSASKRTGTRWSAQMRSPRGYSATHPPGL